MQRTLTSPHPHPPNTGTEPPPNPHKPWTLTCKTSMKASGGDSKHQGRKWQEVNRVKANLWCSAFLCFLTLAKGTTTRTINNGPEQEQQEPEARTRTIWCQGAPHRTCNGVGRVRGASFSNNLGAPPQSCAPDEIQEDTSRSEMLKSLLLVENHFQKIHSNLQYSSSWVYSFRIFSIIFLFQALASVFYKVWVAIRHMFPSA